MTLEAPKGSRILTLGPCARQTKNEDLHCEELEILVSVSCLSMLFRFLQYKSCEEIDQPDTSSWIRFCVEIPCHDAILF